MPAHARPSGDRRKRDAAEPQRLQTQAVPTAGAGAPSVGEVRGAEAACPPFRKGGDGEPEARGRSP